MSLIKINQLNFAAIEELFSPAYIEQFHHEMYEVAANTENGAKNIEAMQNKLLLQQTLNAKRLQDLAENLETAKLKIKILEVENNNLDQLISNSDQGIAEQCEKVESAKETVKESIKFASVFAEENEYETYRGNQYLRIKAKYIEQIFPLYNNALMQANQYLDKVKHAELVEQLLDILQEVLNDANMLAFWRMQVTLTQRFIDASSVKIDGKFYPVPRGIFLARQELDKLKLICNPDKVEIAKQACLEMRKRLGNDKKCENKKKKATTEFYTAVCDCLVGNTLIVTEEKLLKLKTLLKDAIFESLQLPKLLNQQASLSPHPDDRCFIL